MREAIATFRIDHHRTETVLVSGDVLWVDDSKATNPHAAEAALLAFDPIVWVVGGLLKGVDVDELVERNVERLRAAVIIGVDRLALRSAFERHAPALPVFEVDETDTEQVMPQVVRLAAAAALPGDTVLLAPAAASMDQFDSYSDRGRRFQSAVREFTTTNRPGGAAHDDDTQPGQERGTTAGATP